MFHLRPHNIAKRLFDHVPELTCAGYALVAVLWIAFSDQLLTGFAGTYAQYQTLQTYKGWLFVAVTASLLYVVLRLAHNGMRRAHNVALESERRLELALSANNGGVWEYVIDEQGRALSYVSPELGRRMGLPTNRPITGGDWKERVHSDDLPKVLRSMSAAAQSGGAVAHDTRYRIRTGNGSYRWFHSRARLVGSEQGVKRLIGVSLDITEQVQSEERIRQLMYFDMQTGLANRSSFIARLDERLETAPGDGQIALLQVKLHDFDELLDELDRGDEGYIDQIIGTRLETAAGLDGLAGRISHDVFAVATAQTASSDRIQSLVDQVVRALGKPIVLDSRTIGLSFVAGAALWPQDGASAATLLTNSGRAMAKGQGCAAAAVHWFTEGLDAEFRRRSQLLRDMRNIVAKHELECHFQPIIGLGDGRTVGFEALARWRRPGEGLVPPDQFIGLAEEHGYIAEIGQEVLTMACAEAASWPSSGPERPFVAVNVSPLQLDDPCFPATVQDVLARTGLVPERLKLEVTEKALAANPDVARRQLDALREIGCSIAVDDFGAGYSSLHTLSRFPFTRLKIDRSLVRDYGTDRQNTIIVDAVLGLGRALGLTVTAEGIASAALASALRQRHVQCGQGFHFSKPVPRAAARELCERSWLHFLEAA